MKRTPADRGGRSAPITTYGNGPQLLPIVNRHLMPELNGLEHYSLGPSFWKAYDENELSSDGDDSDNPTSRHHRLPA